MLVDAFCFLVLVYLFDFALFTLRSIFKRETIEYKEKGFMYEVPVDIELYRRTEKLSLEEAKETIENKLIHELVDMDLDNKTKYVFKLDSGVIVIKPRLPGKLLAPKCEIVLVDKIA